jgi:hypothetical protein
VKLPFAIPPVGGNAAALRLKQRGQSPGKDPNAAMLPHQNSNQQYRAASRPHSEVGSWTQAFSR